MCRYAYKVYKPHFACFGCRKAFKGQAFADFARKASRRVPSASELKAEYKARLNKCPQCARPMADLGLDFRPPKQTDVKGWKLIERLMHIGITFHGCGCSGPGYIPKEPYAYREFLQNRLKDYKGQLAYFLKSHDDDRDKAMRHWRERITSIELEMSRVR